MFPGVSWYVPMPGKSAHTHTHRFHLSVFVALCRGPHVSLDIRVSLCLHCYRRLGVCEGCGYSCVNAGAKLLSPIILQLCGCRQVTHPLAHSVFPVVKCACLQKRPALVLED